MCGRVGRAKVRAYSYLTTPADRLITDTGRVEQRIVEFLFNGRGIS